MRRARQAGRPGSARSAGHQPTGRWHGMRITKSPMETVVGVFKDRTTAERAVEFLLTCGVPRGRVTLLTPADAGRAGQAVPTTESEPPGIGRALGGVVGSAAGAATGIQAAALSSLFVPGVGPVLTLGILGAIVLGV